MVVGMAKAIPHGGGQATAGADRGGNGKGHSWHWMHTLGEASLIGRNAMTIFAKFM